MKKLIYLTKNLISLNADPQTINDYLATESTFRVHLSGVSFIKGKHEYFPIPQREIDLSAGPDGMPTAQTKSRLLTQVLNIHLTVSMNNV